MKKGACVYLLQSSAKSSRSHIRLRVQSKLNVEQKTARQAKYNSWVTVHFCDCTRVKQQTKIVFRNVKDEVLDQIAYIFLVVSVLKGHYWRVTIT